jgi:two-component system sensor histidine kinase BaeS
MSLRWRILGAFILIIVFTILLSTGVEYWTEGRQLDQFSTKIRTGDLAGVLSRIYTANKSWDGLEPTLIRYGFLIDPAKIREAEEAGIDITKRFPFGIAIKDVEGNIIEDTFSDLAQAKAWPQLEGEPVNIVDFDTEQVVGTVTIYINRDYLAAETREFLIRSLYPTAIGGVITAVIALLLAAWMSRRITAPVIALTQATQAIVQSGDTQHLPVKSSDELGQMSASFNQMMTALQTQQDLRKRLIDDVAHELNTPLSVIRLEAKGLRDEIQTPADAADHIIEEVDALRDLVHDLNWLAETDSGALQLKMASHSLGRLLTTEVERWQLQAQVADVKLALLPLPPDLPSIQLDAVRMSQALGNLIQNGLQHTPAGGRVTVRCRVEDGWVETARTEFVEVAVCDTGSGIAAEELPFVFERFFRTDPSRQRDTGGRGLGLSIVKQIIETHQGQVWAESELGEGSCFRFRLPALGLAGRDGQDFMGVVT